AACHRRRRKAICAQRLRREEDGPLSPPSPRHTDRANPPRTQPQPYRLAIVQRIRFLVASDGVSAGGCVFAVLADPWPWPQSEPCRLNRRRSGFFRPRQKRDTPRRVAAAPNPYGPPLPEEADRRSNPCASAERFQISALAPLVSALAASRPAPNERSNPR